MIAVRNILRTALLGALFVVVGAGVVRAQGAPGDVIATVEGRPAIERATFDRWMRIAASRHETLKAVPDRPAYRVCARQLRSTMAGRGRTLAQRRATCAHAWRELRDSALGFLLASAWVQGEAAELGVAVTAQEIDTAFTRLKQQAFPKEADFHEFLRESGSTEADIRLQLEVERLQEKLVRRILRDVRVTDAEVAAIYRAHPGDYRIPETRDIRYIETRTRGAAARARASLAAGATWRAAARGNGVAGRIEDLQRGQARGRFERVAFGARRGALAGPVRSGRRWYVLRVGRITAGRAQTLREAAPQIREVLTLRREARVLDRFVVAYERKWKARTRCLTGYVVDGCGGALPPVLPPA